MGDEHAAENDAKNKNEAFLEVEVANGIKYAFVTLDEAGLGEVSKSQLQAIVANVCRAIKTTYISDDLDNFLADKQKLTVFEFLDFLETKLLVKGKKLNQKEMDELSWVMVGQKYEDNPHLISKKDAFKLWLAFKKLDIAGDLKVDIEELCFFLEKFIRGMGIEWNEQALHEYAEDGALAFWNLIECLEKTFLEEVDKGVLKEGLQDLFASILDEVTLTGFLYKKGHNMLKSQKSRWFVLKPEHLTYYVSSGYREKKGEIVLNADAKVASIPDKGSNKCRFLVTCGQTKKDFEQTAPDQRTRQAWISAIQTAIDCFGGQTPLKRDLIARKAKRDNDKRQKAEEERKRQEQEDLLNQQRDEIDLLKKRKAEIEKLADDEKAMLDAEIRRREELEEIQRNLQQLLEDQKRAREEEEKVRAAKERLLEEERLKREQLEALRQQQQQELQEEKMQKEELMERQKEQERVLEEERKRLQHLEEERMKAEEAAKAAQDKLTAAETAAKNAAEQAKNRVRQLKTSIGLKGTVGPKVDPLVSHRGKGAFTLEEFLNRASGWSGLPLDESDKYKPQEKPVNQMSDEELVKAAATPTPNKNIPEFLKKAAAWSGLNPDTYLEEGKEEKGNKKSDSPPKVAAKPPKTKETNNGQNGSSEGNEVEKGTEEEIKVPEVETGESGEAQDVEGTREEVEINESVDGKVKDEEEEAKEEEPKQDKVIGEETQEKEEKDERPEEEEIKEEQGKDEVSKEEEGENKGSQEDNESVVPPTEEGKNEEFEAEPKKDEGSQEVDGGPRAEEGDEAPEADKEVDDGVKLNGEGSEIKETKEAEKLEETEACLPVGVSNGVEQVVDGPDNQGVSVTNQDNEEPMEGENHVENEERCESNTSESSETVKTNGEENAVVVPDETKVENTDKLKETITGPESEEKAEENAN